MATKKELVTDENFEELLIKSVTEASEYIRGERELKSRFVSLIEEPPKYTKTKIKKIRSDLGISQSVFANIFGVSVSAVQHWEQGMRNMPSPARRLLDLIEKDSDLIFDLITSDKVS